MEGETKKTKERISRLSAMSLFTRQSPDTVSGTSRE